MRLTAILLIPAIASALSLYRPGRRFAAPITLIASAIVLALSASVAEDVAHSGRLDAAAGWLTCDGLGGLILLLVALVSFTAALFSWGISNGDRAIAAGDYNATMASIICLSFPCSRFRCWRTSPLCGLQLS